MKRFIYVIMWFAWSSYINLQYAVITLKIESTNAFDCLYKRELNIGRLCELSTVKKIFIYIICMYKLCVICYLSLMKMLSYRDNNNINFMGYITVIEL